MSVKTVQLGVLIEHEGSLFTHWGQVTHVCISKLTSIGSDNGLSPGRHQSIIWTSAGILLIGHLETNFSEILNKIYTFSFRKMHLKMSSAKWRPFHLSLNMLNLVYHSCGMRSFFSEVLAVDTSHYWRWKNIFFPSRYYNGKNNIFISAIMCISATDKRSPSGQMWPVCLHSVSVTAVLYAMIL